MIVVTGDQMAKGLSDRPCWTIIMNPTFSEKVLYLIQIMSVSDTEVFEKLLLSSTIQFLELYKRFGSYHICFHISTC